MIKKMMNYTFNRRAVRFFAVVAFSTAFFVSCESTRVYVKTNDDFYENGELVSSTFTQTLDGKVKNKERKVYRKTRVFDDVNNRMLIVKETATSVYKTSGEKSVIQLVDENDNVIAEKSFSKKNGTIDASTVSSASDDSSKKQSDEEKAKAKKEADEKAAKKRSGENSGKKVVALKKDQINALFKKSILTLNGLENVPETPKGGSSSVRLSSMEKATVVSVPNGSYITYSIVGKPFVLLGTTAWNLLKCGGYALVNFIGGYNIIQNPDSGTFWVMPDVKKSKEQAAKAKEANKLAYPEYHLPFTNNHITIEKIDSEVGNAFTDSETVKIVAQEKHEIDNTIKVGRSVAADAYSTASTVGYVGTAVTVPVSAVTWVAGVAAGIAEAVSGK